MGIVRGLWRSSTTGRIIDTVRNIVDESSISEGIKRTIKEDWTEDNIVGKTIYNSGKYDGKKKGYEDASAEYEHKLLEQADLFLKQKKIYENERNLYEELIDEYEKEIRILENKAHKTEEENRFLQELLLRERRLRQINF